MSLHKVVWLILTVFLLTVGVAQSQTLAKNKQELTTTIPSKKWHVDGFRSAKFGMNEKQVMQALLKDFKATKELVLRRINPATKNLMLLVYINDLALEGLDAHIIYTFEFRSKRLINVEVTWGRDVSDKADIQKMALLTNALKKHFLKKINGMQRVILDKVMKDGNTIIFRAQDEKGRWVLFRQTKAITNKGPNLKISYINKPPKPLKFKK